MPLFVVGAPGFPLLVHDVPYPLGHRVPPYRIAVPKAEAVDLAAGQTHLEVFRVGAVRVTSPTAEVLLPTPPASTMSDDGATWERPDAVLAVGPDGTVVFYTGCQKFYDTHRSERRDPCSWTGSPITE